MTQHQGHMRHNLTTSQHTPQSQLPQTSPAPKVSAPTASPVLSGPPSVPTQPLTHPMTRKGSAPSRKRAGGRTMATGRQHCYAAQTAMQQGMEEPSQMVALGWCSEVVGTQLAGPCGTGPSAQPTCLLTLPSALPVGPQLAEGGGLWRRCLQDVFSRCFRCLFTSQLKGQFQTWPGIPGHPLVGRWSLIPLPQNTGQPSNSLLTNGIGQK